MDRNKNRTPYEEDIPVEDRIDERVDRRVDERLDSKLDDRGRPIVTNDHPEERTMEERADRFARERSDLRTRELAEHEADLRARELADERVRRADSERRLDDRIDERVDRRVDDRLVDDRHVDDRMADNRRADDRMADSRRVDDRMDRNIDNHVEHVAGPTVVTPVSDVQPVVERTRPPMISRILNWVTSVILILLALRLIFQLIGAQSGNAIVGSIYGITDTLVAPFAGIVARPAAAGFDLQTVVAMIGYAIIGYALAKLIDVLTPNRIR